MLNPQNSNFNQPHAVPSIQLNAPVHLYNRAVVYPEVDPTDFINSSREILLLLQDAQTITQSLLEKDFAKKVMEAGQQSKKELIQTILSGLPIKSKVDISYTPYTVKIILKPISHGPLSSTITMDIIWNKTF